MGFNEDDRIRNKNTVHNIAYDLYTGMSGIGLCNEDIVGTCQRIIDNKSDPTRNEIYLEILKIAGRSNEKVNDQSADNDSADVSFSD